MGTLVQVGTSFVHLLETETLIGRSPRSQLPLADPLVSTHHASLMWSDGSWQLRDLGSRNGTFVDGRRLSADETVRLAEGMQLAFGSKQLAFCCTDLAAPGVRLVAVAGDEVIAIDNALVAIPSPERPCATLALGEDGLWTIELGDETRLLSDQQVVEIDGVRYRFCEGRGAPRTMTGRRSMERTGVAALELELACSRDEEHVELTVTARGQRHQLGARSCYYALLMLARCRLGQGLPSTVKADRDGWVATSTLATMLSTTEQHVNVDIFRLRKALQSAGIADAATLVERKSGLLRLATDRVRLRQI